MASKAFAKFKKTIVRCEALIKSYKTLHDQNQEDGNIHASKDIVRGAVVLAVAALDTYATDVFCEKLVTYLKKYKPDQPLIELLANAGLDTKETLTLITMERPYRRIRTLIQRYYQVHTTQNFQIIDDLFLPYRLKDITSNAAAKSGKVSIKKSVGKLVERRHEITHGGDYNSHGKIKKINEQQMDTRIKDLENLVVNMDEIICNRI